jgi:hypothetical protein
MWAAVSLAAPGLSEVNTDSGLAPVPPTPVLPTTQDPQQLLEHFNNTLEQLCTVPGPDARRNIKALTSLAEHSATSAPAKALHLAILAWAGKHLWSQGEMQYETPADRAGAESGKLLGELLACFSADWPQTERITLLAAVLMTIQFKVGDIHRVADGRSPKAIFGDIPIIWIAAPRSRRPYTTPQIYRPRHLSHFSCESKVSAIRLTIATNICSLSTLSVRASIGTVPCWIQRSSRPIAIFHLTL